MERFFFFFFVDFLMLDAETFVMYFCMAQCVCLVDELGNRTMRPCLSNAVKVQVLCFFFFFFFFWCVYMLHYVMSQNLRINIGFLMR